MLTKCGPRIRPRASFSARLQTCSNSIPSNPRVLAAKPDMTRASAIGTQPSRAQQRAAPAARRPAALCVLLEGRLTPDLGDAPRSQGIGAVLRCARSQTGVGGI